MFTRFISCSVASHAYTPRTCPSKLQWFVFRSLPTARFTRGTSPPSLELLRVNDPEQGSRCIHIHQRPPGSRNAYPFSKRPKYLPTKEAPTGGLLTSAPKDLGLALR